MSWCNRENRQFDTPISLKPLWIWNLLWREKLFKVKFSIGWAFWIISYMIWISTCATMDGIQKKSTKTGAWGILMQEKKKHGNRWFWILYGLRKSKSVSFQILHERFLSRIYPTQETTLSHVISENWIFCSMFIIWYVSYV